MSKQQLLKENKELKKILKELRSDFFMIKIHSNKIKKGNIKNRASDRYWELLNNLYLNNDNNE